VGRALSNRFVDYEVSSEVEGQIYCSFYSALDKSILEEFLVSSWTHRSKLVNKLNDKRLRQLGQRLIYLNLPEIVSDRYKSAAKTVIRERWLTNDIEVPWMTMAMVEKQLLEIEATGVTNAQFCSQLQRYYKNKKVL
jgi:exodeoxyribonuclease-1